MLCKSHITQLKKIATKLAHKLTMSSSQMIVGKKNRKLIERAEAQIYDTMATLRKVE